MINNEKILSKFIQINDNLNWYDISNKYILSENFIRKYKNKVFWTYISIYQKLSDDFIREFQNEIN